MTGSFALSAAGASTGGQYDRRRECAIISRSGYGLALNRNGNLIGIGYSKPHRLYLADYQTGER
jgi:hypothetical protein